MRSYSHTEDIAFKSLLGVLNVSFALFPIVYVLAATHMISMHTEETLYTICECACVRVCVSICKIGMCMM
jgi:hypothetical protein